MNLLLHRRVLKSNLFIRPIHDGRIQIEKKQVDHYSYLPTKHIPWQQLVDVTDLSTRQVTPITMTNSEKQLSPAQKKSEFSVLTYNILADSIRNSFENTLNNELPYTLRNLYILDEIKRFTPDIICLQEIEAQLFSQFYLPQLEIEGYAAYYQHKKYDTTNFPATKDWSEQRSDGCAIFWRTDKFRMVREDYLEYRQGLYSANFVKYGFNNPFFMKQFIRLRNVLTMVHLECVDASPRNFELVVANTHIYANLAKRAIQFGQIYSGLCSLYNFCNGLDYPLLLCGDFNVVPHSMPYNFLATGRVSHSDPAFTLSVDNQAKLTDRDVESPFALKSAYATITGDEPNTLRFGLPSDYLWYNPSALIPTSVASLPEYSLRHQKYVRLSDKLPSDHLPLFGKFVVSSFGPLARAPYNVPHMEFVRRPVGRRKIPHREDQRGANKSASTNTSQQQNPEAKPSKQSAPSPFDRLAQASPKDSDNKRKKKQALRKKANE